MTYFRPIPRSLIVGVTIPPVALIVGFIIVPITAFIVRSGHGLLPALTEVVTKPVYRHVTTHTLFLSFAAAAAASILGASYAATSYLSSGLARRALLLLVTLPLSASLLARLLAFTLLLQRYGFVNQLLIGFHFRDSPARLLYRSTTVVIGIAYVFVPYVVLIVFTALQRIDVTIVRAATSAGASLWKRLLTLEWPLARHSLVTTAGLVAVLASGYYITPALLGGRSDQTLPMLIEMSVNRLLDWPLAAALCLVLLGVVASLAAIAGMTMSVVRKR